MEKDVLDRTFRKHLENISGLPPDVRWNSEKGWNDYADQYLFKKIFRRRLLVFISSAAAAVFLVLVSIGIFRNMKSETKSVTNNTDRAIEVILPDGNRVWLNLSSTIEFPVKSDHNQGDILVDGEAYFEIRNFPKQLYRIKARNAVIVAENSGSFNIRARMHEENVNITVASGSIKIMEESYQSGLALLVTEGNYCSVHKSQNLVYASANRNENYLAWKTGKLTFRDVPMATVTDILAEYYRKKIEIEDKSLAYCLFTGTFKGQSIDMVLNQMQMDLNVEIKNTGDKILISGKGCL